MRKIVLWIVLLLFQPIRVSAISVADYLVDTDIGSYSKSYAGACAKGSGIIAGAGHFRLDHIDSVCDIRYYNEALDLGVEVQVTQHAGSDSDRWLLHEVERDFRNYYGLPDDSYSVRQIDSNAVLAFSAAGWSYRWVSANKVVEIEFHDSQMTKPEPLEVVRAYLAKHPSTLAPLTSTDIRTAENKTKWIKNEMGRRLWLGDKWFLQIQTGKVEMNRVIKEAVDHMNVFLDYRKKYFGMDAQEEKKALSGFQQAQDGTAIKKKLTEYKTWWEANKGRAINFP
jgi:hypothetical protein